MTTDADRPRSDEPDDTNSPDDERTAGDPPPGWKPAPEEHTIVGPRGERDIQPTDGDPSHSAPEHRRDADAIET